MTNLSMLKVVRDKSIATYSQSTLMAQLAVNYETYKFNQTFNQNVKQKVHSYI